MDTKALRQKILDLAIRGKLVPQDPNDEPATVLLERIREEKKQMVKDGKLKAKDIKNDTVIFRGEDNLHYEKFQDGTVKCIEDEIPFEVPDGWGWCNLGHIFNHNTGKALNSSNIKGTHYTYITTSNVYWDHFELDDLKTMPFTDDEIEKCTVKKGDLLVCEGGDIGRSAIWEYDYDMRIQNHIHRLRPYGDVCVKLYYYILYYYKCNGKISGQGIGLQGFSSNRLHATIVPLPPLNEQKKIAECLDNLFSVIILLEKEKKAVSELIEYTRAKILDLAIRGKLTTQNPNDEPASNLLERIRAEKEELIKQGRLKRDKKESIIYKGDDNSYYEKLTDGSIINIDNDLPFQIPENWNWVRLSSICKKEIKRGKSPKYVGKSGVLVFAQKCNLKAGGINYNLCQYLDEDTLAKYDESEYMQQGDSIINSTGTGTLGRIGYIDIIAELPIVPDSHVTTVRVMDSMESFYIYALLKSLQPVLEKSGEGSTNQKELKPHTIQDIFVPIPPLQEQRRICKQIEKSLGVLTRIEGFIN